MALYLIEYPNEPSEEKPTAARQPAGPVPGSPSRRTGPLPPHQDLAAEMHKRRMWARGDEAKGRKSSSPKAIDWWLNPDA